MSTENKNEELTLKIDASNFELAPVGTTTAAFKGLLRKWVAERVGIVQQRQVWLEE